MIEILSLSLPSLLYLLIVKQCDVCLRRFSKNQSLRNHKARIHEGKTSKDFECPKCHKKFSGQLAHIPRQLHHLCSTAMAISSEEGFNEHELSVFVRRLAAVVKLASSPAQGRDVKA